MAGRHTAVKASAKDVFLDQERIRGVEDHQIPTQSFLDAQGHLGRNGQLPATLPAALPALASFVKKWAGACHVEYVSVRGGVSRGGE